MSPTHRAAGLSAAAGVCQQAACRQARRKDAALAVALAGWYFCSFSKRFLSLPTSKKSSAAKEETC